MNGWQPPADDSHTGKTHIPCISRDKTCRGRFGARLSGHTCRGALLALALEAGGGGFDAAANFDTYLWRVARFTIWQAVASSLLSVLFAIPIARALYAEARFPGRGLILRLFAQPLALPALVAVLGVTSIYGRNGLIAHISDMLGHPMQPDIYGIAGILIAHIFFNMPLAVRLLLAAYESIPDDHWKLAAQLGMGSRARFRLIDWPVIRRSLPGMIGLVFMLCVTSFTTVLTLGGGPRATTLEVAIYQSLHFDFDPARAVALTFTQLALTLLILLILRLTGRPSEEGFTQTATPRRYGAPEKRSAFSILSLSRSAFFMSRCRLQASSFPA